MKRALFLLLILSMTSFSLDYDDIKDKMKDDFVDKLEDNFDKKDYDDLSEKDLKRRVMNIVRREFPNGKISIDVEDDEIEIEVKVKDDDLVSKEKKRRIRRKIESISGEREVKVEIED